MSIESNLRKQYAQTEAQERATLLLWDGFSAMRASRIFYWDGPRQFLEPYVGKVLNIKISHPPPTPDPYIGGVPPPTG